MIGSDGNLQGVGLFINVEPSSGHLVSSLRISKKKFPSNFRVDFPMLRVMFIL